MILQCKSVREKGRSPFAIHQLHRSRPATATTIRERMRYVAFARRWMRRRRRRDRRREMQPTGDEADDSGSSSGGS